MPAGRIQLIAPARRNRKPRRSRKGSSLSSVKKEVKSLKKFVMKTIENKQMNYSSSESGGALVDGIAILSTGIVQRPTLNLTQGVADGDDRPSAARIGNSVTLLRESINMMLTQQKDVTHYSKVRLLVVESVDGNQYLDFDDVLQFCQEYGIDGTNDGVFTSHYCTKTDTNKRYKVHFDKQYVLGVEDAGMSKPAFMNIKCNVKYGKTGKVVEYNGNASTPTNHNLQIFAVSDRIGTVQPLLSYNIRSTYKDA